MSFIMNLPAEITCIIASNLDNKSLTQFNRSCKNIYFSTAHEVEKRKNIWLKERDLQTRVYIKTYIKMEQSYASVGLLELIDKIYHKITPEYKKFLYEEEKSYVLNFLEQRLINLFFRFASEKSEKYYIEIFNRPILQEIEGYLVDGGGNVYYYSRRSTKKSRCLEKYWDENPGLFVPKIFLYGKYVNGVVRNLSRIEYNSKNIYDYAVICPHCGYITCSPWNEDENCVHCRGFIPFTFLGPPLSRICCNCEYYYNEDETVCPICDFIETDERNFYNYIYAFFRFAGL